MRSDFVDMHGLAELLGVTYTTVRTYRRRGELPPEDFTVGGSPAWRRETIEEWRTSRPGRGHRSDLE